MIKNRLALYALCFLAGVVVLQFQQQLPSISMMVIIFIGASVAFIFASTKWLSFLLAGFVWAGVFGYYYLSHIPDSNIAGKDIQVSGQVVDLPVNDEKISRFVFEIDTFKVDLYQARIPSRVRLNWYYPDTKIEPGQRWVLIIRLKPPNGFQNPGGFDYESWLYQQGLHATGYVRKSEQNHLISASQSWFGFDHLRFVIRDKINSLVGAEIAPVINALTIGYRGGLSPEMWHLFIATGTSHLMAISGLHIGLVAGFAWFVFRQLMRIPQVSILMSRRSLLVLSFSAAFFYAGLAGFTIPTQRALLMLTTVYTGLYFYRQVSAAKTLSVALLVVLIFSPVSVLSAGFWLSFLAVAVITYCISGRLPGRQRLLSWLWPQIAVVTMLIPLSLYFFQQSSTLATVANLVAIPLVSLLILPLLLVALVLQFLSVFLADLIYLIAEKLISLLLTFLDVLASSDFSLWHFPQPDLLSLIMALAGMSLLFLPYAIPSRWLSIFLFIPLLTNAGHQSRSIAADKQFEVHVIDVGQGLSVLLRTKNHQLLFDTGARFSPRFDVGERVIIPFLKYQGITDLDILMISNGDRDHIGGAQAVIRGLGVSKVVGQDIEVLQHRQRTLCKRGQKWQWDGVSFEVLHPDPVPYQKRNNYSCVLRVSNEKGAILIAADIEKRAERSLIEAYGEGLQSSVLIVPHHGSKTSSTISFLQHVKPALAIVSAGYLNRYHLPHRDIGQRYQQLGIKMLSTADRGQISLVVNSDGKIKHLSEYRQQYSRYWHRQNALLYKDELSN